MSGWARVHLDEIPEIPVGGRDWNLTWRPVRMTLDVRAFGTNAYTANEAGVDVVGSPADSLALLLAIKERRAEVVFLTAPDTAADSAAPEIGGSIEPPLSLTFTVPLMRQGVSSP